MCGEICFIGCGLVKIRNAILTISFSQFFIFLGPAYYSSWYVVEHLLSLLSFLLNLLLKGFLLCNIVYMCEEDLKFYHLLTVDYLLF